MTESRPEIIVEGSNDRITWETYQFSVETGGIWQLPPNGLHRINRDSIGKCGSPHSKAATKIHRGFSSFMGALLHGQTRSATVGWQRIRFQTHPPRYIRAALYDYTFTNATTKRSEGTWWHPRMARESIVLRFHFDRKIELCATDNGRPYKRSTAHLINSLRVLLKFRE